MRWLKVAAVVSVSILCFCEGGRFGDSGRSQKTVKGGEFTGGNATTDCRGFEEERRKEGRH